MQLTMHQWETHVSNGGSDASTSSKKAFGVSEAMEDGVIQVFPETASDSGRSSATAPFPEPPISVSPGTGTPGLPELPELPGLENPLVSGPTEGDDILIGTPGEDDISGLGGNDTIRGEAGNDALFGNAGNDVMSGGFNNDELLGGGGRDTLNGDGGADILRGGAGSDRLNGNAGRDILLGDRGSDRLRGGGGRDTFGLQSGPGVDRILDFRDRSDRLGLSGGLDFDDLSFVRRGRNTLIRLGNDPLALVLRTQPDQLTEQDFVTI